MATDLDFKGLHLSLKDQTPILVELDIQPKTLVRTLAEVTVFPDPVPARLQPAQVAVTVQGPWPRVKELKPGDLKARVETGNLGPGHPRLRVSVDLPEGISLVRVQPAWVTAVREKSP
jgi:YbbR domain-containing protein